MPLLDHFNPPLSLQRPWESFHIAWASAIASHLNRGLLPPDYFALPQTTVGIRIEANVSMFKQQSGGGANGPVALQTWAPPRPGLSARVDFVELPSFEVHIHQQMGGAKWRAVIELVSPANKDRESHRLAFAVKCAAYLQKGISLVVIDLVTDRKANLHAQLLEVLRQTSNLAWESPSDLSSVAYRAVPWKEGDRLDIWPEVLTIGTALPTMPLWLDDELCIPLRLEESYLETCSDLRIPT